MPKVNGEIISKLFIVLGIVIVFSIAFLVIFFLARAFKKFLFELIDHANGNSPRTNASKKGYTAEARRAYESVTSKRKKDEKPPWEE